MFAQDAEAAFSLDISTLVVVATSVTALLGLLLLFAWAQERIRALAWWGAAYLVGGFSVGLWFLSGNGSTFVPSLVPSALLFLACGMIWSAARLFHGRPVLWVGMTTGSMAWLLAGAFPSFAEAGHGRVVVAALIISTYTFLTAAELWRERRKTLMRRWPALFVPVLHGAVFMLPIPLAGIMPEERGVMSLASGWVAVFALEMILYAVGTAFIVLVLSKEQTLRMHKTAAVTDPMTGLFNRRGFVEGVQQVMAAQARRNEPVCVLVFDLDHFKSINDRFGHAVGDETLKLFASSVVTNVRASDLVARLGGEEFAAVISGTLEQGVNVAERVRVAFETAGRAMSGHYIGASVSVGVASGNACEGIDALLARADEALYGAKNAGRNRVGAYQPENACRSGATPAEIDTSSLTPNAPDLTFSEHCFWTAYRRPNVINDISRAA